MSDERWIWHCPLWRLVTVSSVAEIAASIAGHVSVWFPIFGVVAWCIVCGVLTVVEVTCWLRGHDWHGNSCWRCGAVRFAPRLIPKKGER